MEVAESGSAEGSVGVRDAGEGGWRLGADWWSGCPAAATPPADG
jgi:hypothetical protein